MADRLYPSNGQILVLKSDNSEWAARDYDNGLYFLEPLDKARPNSLGSVAHKGEKLYPFIDLSSSVWSYKSDSDDKDPVNQPAHYTSGTIECIDYIESCLGPEQFKGWLRGNIIKYQHRYQFKGKPLEDLKKIEFYLKKLQEVEDNG